MPVDAAQIGDMLRLHFAINPPVLDQTDQEPIRFEVRVGALSRTSLKARLELPTRK